MKCKKTTPNKDETTMTAKNGRNMMKANCSDCDHTKFKFIATQKGKGKETALISKESYKGKNKRKEEVEGYKLDKEASNKNIAVYKDDKTGKAIIANRGTDLSNKKKALEDLKNDALILLGQSNKIKRVEKTKKAIEDLQNKGYDITTTGHSLGARVAFNASKNKDVKSEIYSVGSSPADFLKKQNVTNPNIISHKNKYDPVALSSRALNIKNEDIKKDVVLNPHALSQFGKGKYLKKK